MTGTFFFSILTLFTDNNWLDLPWGCYLSNLVTLVFTTFEISKHSTFRYCLFEMFWNLPIRIRNGWIILTQDVIYLRATFYFTPWLVHLFIKKGPLGYPFFSILTLLIDNKWFGHPWGCYIINSATLISITFEMSKHPSFVEWYFWNFSESLSANLQLLNLRLEVGLRRAYILPPD